MIATTPFHPRLAELNRTGLWRHWSGYLAAPKYNMSAKHEYFGIRNAAAFFDSSPMYKYWIRGRDAERFLGGVFARDPRTMKPGRAQYTVWVDDDGYTVEDGVLFRHSSDEFFLTAAEPNLSFFEGLVGRLQVEITDVSADYGFLAVQGPKSRDILAALAPEVTALSYFGFAPMKAAGIATIVSRTGYSGDLGYEILVRSEDALTLLDAVIDAGQGYQLRPFGEDALNTARIEAGLPLIGVEFTSARLAYTEAQKVTPWELGLGWMLKNIDDPSRPFIGRKALRRERDEKTSRWSTVGLLVEPKAYHDLHATAGLVPEYDDIAAGWETMLYDDEGERAGYAPSYVYSPILQSYIAIARVRPELATVGTTIHVEQTVNHEYVTVPATVTTLPFYSPSRKTA